MIMKDEYLSKEEKAKLLEIAKLSIIEAVTGKRQFLPNVTEEKLKENCGAFVTIKENNQLRGCIGYIQAVKPLYETVKDVAKSAAINDYRFNPVAENELEKLELEISVLTPLKKIKDINEIEVGKHGLVMKKGFNSGLLLPQVATEYGWDRETFLRETCRKAGLPQDAWKDKSTEIFIFSAEVFGETN
jgi:AmmeMemoRadiSam system protein A